MRVPVCVRARVSVTVASSLVLQASALAHQLSAAEHRIASLEHELTVTADAASARVWATVGGLTEAKTAAEVECVRLRGEVTELKQRMREREEEDMEGRERSKREREREEEKERKEKLQREEEARVLKSLVEGLREQLDGAVASAASSRHVHDAELSQAIAVAEAATAAAVAAKEAQSRTESVCKGLEDKIGMLTADLQAARVASAVLAREKGRQGARSLTRQMVPSPGAFSDDMGPASPGPALWMSGPLSGSFDAADSPPVHPTFTTTADAQQQPYVPMTAQEALLNPASLHMECVEQQRRFEGIIAEMRKDMEGAAATIRRLTVERDKLLEQSNILHAKLRRLTGLSSGVGPTGYEYPSINEVAVAMRSPPAPPPAPSVPVSPPPVSVPSRSPPRSRRSPKVRVSPPPVTVGNQFLADEDIGVVGKALTNQESAEPPVLTGVVKPSERRSAQKESQRRIARVKATLDEKRRVWSGGH